MSIKCIHVAFINSKTIVLIQYQKYLRNAHVAKNLHVVKKILLARNLVAMDTIHVTTHI